MWCAMQVVVLLMQCMVTVQVVHQVIGMIVRSLSQCHRCTIHSNRDLDVAYEEVAVYTK